MGLVIVSPCDSPQVVRVEEPKTVIPMVSSVPKVVGAGIRGPRGIGGADISTQPGNQLVDDGTGLYVPTVNWQDNQW